MTPDSLFDALLAAIRRLELDPRQFPGGGLAGDRDAIHAFVRHLESLAPPTTWADVVAGLPERFRSPPHESPGRRYRPLTPYDHQSLPTGPALHVSWPKSTDPGCLDALVGAARAAGFGVYGAGFIPIENPRWRSIDALMILDAGTPEARLSEFIRWLDEWPEVSLAAVPRTGAEVYSEDL